MGRKAELIEQFTKTFGIEVEFCSIKNEYSLTEFTENNESITDEQLNQIKLISDCLSYTHIEVCTLNHNGHQWKIETDADYTLELVSPILKFESHQKANEFKRELINELARFAKKSGNLGTCVTKILTFIKGKNMFLNIII